MNFIEAKEQCEQDGTSLVIPKSGKKIQFVILITQIYFQMQKMIFFPIYSTIQSHGLVLERLKPITDL